jgi:hypothetical protein
MVEGILISLTQVSMETVDSLKYIKQFTIFQHQLLGDKLENISQFSSVYLYIIL